MMLINVKPLFLVNKIDRLWYSINNCNVMIKIKPRFTVITISFKKKK